MHSKVAGAIQEIDAALFNGDTFDGPEDRAELASYVERWSKELAGLDRQAKLKHCSSAFAPARVRAAGSWADAAGVVHAVNTAGAVAWDPDQPGSYPTTTDASVDCMSCLVARARSCL